jgi:hypothetical protein
MTARMQGVGSFKIFVIYLKYTRFLCVLCFQENTETNITNGMRTTFLHHGGKISTINTLQGYNSFLTVTAGSA